MWVLMENVGEERTVEVNYVFLVIYFVVFYVLMFGGGRIVLLVNMAAIRVW